MKSSNGHKLGQLLLVADSPIVARGVHTMLDEGSAREFDFLHVARLSDAISRLQTTQVSCVLLDLTLPDADGLDAVVQVRKAAPDVPIVVLNAHEDGLAIEAMRAGAQDYLVQGRVDSDLINRSIRYAIERKRVAQYLRAQQAVTRVLAESGTLEFVLPDVLRALGEILGWEAGALWTVAPDSDTLQCDGGWHASSVTSSEFAVFKANRMSSGDVPTRAWGESEESWVEDMLAAGGAPTASQADTRDDEQLRVAIWFPVLSGKNALGVMEFYSRTTRPSEKELIETTVAIGRQIGQFIERTEAEQAAERLKDEFLALVSHDLRTPLTSIKGFLEILLEGHAGDFSPDAHHFLEMIAAGTARLERLVGDLLFVAEVEAGRFSLDIGEVDLGELLEACVGAVRHRAKNKKIALTLDCGQSFKLAGDQDRLAQLFDNLLSNAIKYTPQGGSIELRASSEESVAVIELQDSGMGISPADQEHLFERFFRTSRAIDGTIPGVGVGLTVVKAIAEGHHGGISVDSKEDAGTTFRVELPFRGPQEAEVATTTVDTREAA